MLKHEYEIFLCIYEQQSLSRAADVLDKYQAALSKLLSKVESDLNTQLFIRSNRGLVPTDAGHQLYNQVKIQKNLWQQFQKKKSEKAEEVSGNLRVGGHPSVLIQFSNILSRIISLYPKLEVEFDLDRSPQITRKVLNHELDIAIVANPNKFDDLVIRNLKAEKVGLYSKEEQPKSTIVYNPELITSSSILKSLPKKQFQMIEIKDYGFAAQLAKKLNGSALLPESLAKKEGLTNAIGKSYYTASLCLIYRSDHRVNKKILDLIKIQ